MCTWYQYSILPLRAALPGCECGDPLDEINYNYCGSLERRSDWRALRRALAIGLFGILIANSGMTGILTLVSRMNYPGGEGMAKLHTIIHPTRGADLGIRLQRMLLRSLIFSGSFHRRPCSAVRRVIIHARVLRPRWALWHHAISWLPLELLQNVA